MKKRVICVMAMAVALLMLLAGCADSADNADKVSNIDDADNKETFRTVTDAESFQNIPLMTGEQLAFSEVEDVGGDNNIIWAKNTTKSEYEAYLAVLETDGYEKYVDNGDGVDGNVYTSHYLKENSLVMVTYFPRLEDTMITVCSETKLSKHLRYDENEVKDNMDGAKTTLAMPELWQAGNSFVFQLKNGHFIINDGGYEEDLPYLLDYLEEKAPAGEKPVVEAWIISHAHTDHMGAFMAFRDHSEWCDRISLEAFYFTTSSEEACEIAGANSKVKPLIFYLKTLPYTFKTTTGEKTESYRLREGERYFFNDITMDVIYVQDLLPYQKWKTWNATSTVLMYNIEGQKVLITADTDWECQMFMLDIFDDAYFSDLTVYQAPHHGGNVYNEFSRHLMTETVLYPTYMVERLRNNLLGRHVQNDYLQNSRSKESLGWLEGGVVLTFPYHAGEYERLPLTEWKYTEETASRMQKN